MKKRILCLSLAVLMLLTSVFTLASCMGNTTTPPVTNTCTNHVDTNHDGKCDAAACTKADMEVTHTDANSDGKCDVCGKDNSHVCVDSDADCECDVCGEACHTDLDEDYECDLCGEPTHDCVDADENSYCDVCDGEMEEEYVCTDHYDDDIDGKCDECGETLVKEHECADYDGNDKCDECGKAIEDKDDSVVVVTKANHISSINEIFE